MTLRVLSRVAFARLQMPGVFASWVAGSPSLDRFLGRRAMSAADVLKAAPARSEGPPASAARRLVAEGTAEYAQRLGAPQAVLDAAERLARPGTVAIVTGQQPALLGGPLYVTHKIATALRLAREIRALPGAPDVVTVFWNHSDDHDWGEANHSYLVNPALDVQRVRLAMPTTGRPLYQIPVGAAVRQVLLEARDLVPATADAEHAFAALAPAADDEALGLLQARLLFACFGSEGLLVLEPSALSHELRAPLAQWHARAEALRASVKVAAAELVDRGFDSNVDPEAPLLFSIGADGKRRGVPDGEPCPAGSLASPGVLLRNAWQDAILPTLAYVAGPGEVAYLALVRSIYEACGVARPALVPRVSVTHVAPRLYDDLVRWELELMDLERGAKVIEERIAGREGGDDEGGGGEQAERAEDALLALAAELQGRLRGLEPRVAEVDPGLCHALSRIASRSTSELRKFVQKLGNQRRNQAGRFRQRARRLCAELMPHGRLQERVLPLLPFLARDREFARRVIEVASPFATEHLLVAADSTADPGQADA